MSAKPLDLKNAIQNKFFIVCPFLTTDGFIKYRKERGVKTSRKQLERFEELGLFFPVARVRHPIVKRKIEYSDDGNSYMDLGPLEDGEKWTGDVREESAGFVFTKEYAEAWLKAGFLWEPSSRAFEAWDNSRDEDARRRVESYYSAFQCYPLRSLINGLTVRVHAEWWTSYGEEEIGRFKERATKLAEDTISFCRENGVRGTRAAELCQAISNRYFPSTQTDRRTLNLSYSGSYRDWDWHEYSRSWDAQNVLDGLRASPEEVKRLQEVTALDAKHADPLEKWYELLSFVSVEQRKKLKGDALLAQTLYSMEHMLRLFYEDLTGERLPPPDESLGFTSDRLYGEGVSQDELEFLELLTNRYHLNPRPKLLLVVEGDGEEEQFPRLIEGLFGVRLPQVGIEVLNIGGIGNFTGDKKRDKRGALERLIDNYHASAPPL